MKKYFAIALAIILCMSFVACGSDSSVEIGHEAEPEVISVDTLIADLENLARAELNIGKATYLFGTINSIGTESITLKHIFLNRTFTVPLESAILVELNKGDYIAIYAVVEEINNGNFKFTKCKQAEMELMDNYVINFVSTTATTTLIKNYSSAIENYIVSRGDTFKMVGDQEIASYVIGKWYWPYHMGLSGTYVSDLEYFADGECIWSAWDSYFNEWDDAYCSWSVKDGIFSGCSSEKTAVYKITENAMVTARRLYIRGK